MNLCGRDKFLIQLNSESVPDDILKYIYLYIFNFVIQLKHNMNIFL